MIVLSTLLFYSQGVNITPYVDVMPTFIGEDCPNLRIDIVDRNNKYFDAYAWFSGRIIIYDGNNLSLQDKQRVFLHELGHLCYRNRSGSYDFREKKADMYVQAR